MKNKPEAKERSLSSGYNFKEKQAKVGKLWTSSLLSETVVLNSVVYNQLVSM